INRGAAYEKIGRKDLAGADYDTVIKLYPDWEVGHRKRAELLTEMGRGGEAIASYTKRVELEPDNAFNWSDRGDAYRAAGDLDHALADYGAAIDRKPGDPRFWHGRAITYQALGDNAHALADLDKTLELSPNYARAYRERAEIHRAMGDVAAAKADEDSAAKVPKNWPEAGEFMLFVVLGLLLNPINIIGSVAAAVLLRPRWLSLTVAVAVGAAEGLIGPVVDLYEALFTPRGLKVLSWVTMLPAVMYGSVSLVWWGLVRWLYGLRRQRPPRPQAT
ncbi:MAG: tetratricopeptide repeat protein, partial [Pseudolabrys sp.]